MNNKVIKNENEVFIFEGKTCPYKQPILIPSQIAGNVQLQAFSCSSECPHFIIMNTAEANKINLKINCGAESQFLSAELITITKPKFEL